MATSLPYLQSYKNLETLFAKIATAKVPDKFTHEFLQKTIGLKGTNDRPFIPLLRTLGFLDTSGTPTAAYRLLKNAATAKAALAAAIRKAYKPLFDADENANALSNEKLKGLVAQVAGTHDEMTSRIAATFNALNKLALPTLQWIKNGAWERAGVGQDEREWLRGSGICCGNHMLAS
jgi:hypothetical protein